MAAGNELPEPEIAVTPTFLIVTYSKPSIDQLATVLWQKDCSFETSVRRDPEAPAFDPQRHVGLIILDDREGDSSDMNLYGQETAWLGAALRNNKPVLGIGHGAQLLAIGFGTKEDKRKGFKDQGMPEVYFTAKGVQDPLTKHLLDFPFPFQWHEHSHTAPASGEQLLVSSNASRPHCDAFRVGRYVYGLQFHPEVSMQAFRSSANTDEPWEPQDASDEALMRAAGAGKKVLEAWVELALETC